MQISSENSIMQVALCRLYRAANFIIQIHYAKSFVLIP